MTWVAHTDENQWHHIKAKSARWYVYQQHIYPEISANVISPEAADAPVFGPLSGEQAARLALLLNDLQRRGP